MTLLEVLKNNNPTLLSSGQIKMLCPFTELHNSTIHASMFLSPEINAFHCFSCKSSGRMTLLLQDKFEVPYYEAVKFVNLTNYKENIGGKKRFSDTEYYWDIVAPKQFLERGFTADLLRKFKVGMHVKDNLIVIPMYDKTSVLQGLKYRVAGTHDFWYSKGFRKDEMLYNENNLSHYDEVILVEGETDTWSWYANGKQVVSSLGVSLSEWQVNELSKFKKVLLGYNSDRAGINGTVTAYKKLSKYTKVLILGYPKKDAAECTLAELKTTYENPFTYAEFKLLT